MIHLNGNLLCAIDCETTGLQAGYHDLIQVCLLPLDFNIKPHKKHTPFELKIKPRRRENIDLNALEVNKATLYDICITGLDPDVAADLFDDWFDKLRLPEGKRISPLGHNWAFDRNFVADWMGQANFDYRIDGRYRDTMSTALYINDCADHNAQGVPFPKISLKYCASVCGIEWDAGRAHDAVYDCLKTAEVYRKMLTMKGYL